MFSIRDNVRRIERLSLASLAWQQIKSRVKELGRGRDRHTDIMSHSGVNKLANAKLRKDRRFFNSANDENWHFYPNLPVNMAYFGNFSRP